MPDLNGKPLEAAEHRSAGFIEEGWVPAVFVGGGEDVRLPNTYRGRPQSTTDQGSPYLLWKLRAPEADLSKLWLELFEDILSMARAKPMQRLVWRRFPEVVKTDAGMCTLSARFVFEERT